MAEVSLTAPENIIQIKPIHVSNLARDIEIQIPLSVPFNSANPNRTLSCGFIDTEQYIFKQAGLKTKLDDEMAPKIVSCFSSHLTQFGVEEYTDEFKNRNIIVEEEKAEKLIRGKEPVFECWASFLTTFLLVLWFALSLWGYRKDERDEINYIVLKQNRLKQFTGWKMDPNWKALQDRLKNTQKRKKRKLDFEDQEKLVDKQKDQEVDPEVIPGFMPMINVEPLGNQKKDQLNDSLNLAEVDFGKQASMSSRSIRPQSAPAKDLIISVSNYNTLHGNKDKAVDQLPGEAVVSIPDVKGDTFKDKNGDSKPVFFDYTQGKSVRSVKKKKKKGFANSFASQFNQKENSEEDEAEVVPKSAVGADGEEDAEEEADKGDRTFKSQLKSSRLKNSKNQSKKQTNKADTKKAASKKGTTKKGTTNKSMGITDMFSEGGEMEFEGGSDEDDIEEIAAKTMNNTMRTTKRITKKKKKKKKGLTARKGFFGQTAKSQVPEEKEEDEDEQKEEPQKEEDKNSNDEDLKEEEDQGPLQKMYEPEDKDGESDAEEGAEVVQKGKEIDAMRTGLSFATYKQTKAGKLNQEAPDGEEDADEEEKPGPKMVDGKVTAANRSRLFNQQALLASEPDEEKYVLKEHEQDIQPPKEEAKYHQHFGKIQESLHSEEQHNSNTQIAEESSKDQINKQNEEPLQDQKEPEKPLDVVPAVEVVDEIAEEKKKKKEQEDQGPRGPQAGEDVVEFDYRYQDEAEFEENQLDAISDSSNEEEKDMLELVLMKDEERNAYEAEQKQKMLLRRQAKMERLKKEKTETPCLNILCKQIFVGNSYCTLHHHFNDYVPRSIRVALLLGQILAMSAITGYMLTFELEEQEVESTSQQRLQFGMLAAVLVKVWSLFIIFVVRRVRRDPRFRDSSMEDYWQKQIKPVRDSCCYRLGFILTFGTFIAAAALNYVLCRWYMFEEEKTQWLQTFINAFFIHLLLIESIAIIWSLSVLRMAGISDESCGKCRNCCLMMVNQANRDNLY